MRKTIGTKILAYCLAGAVTASTAVIAPASAFSAPVYAAAAVKLNKTTASVKAGKKITLKVTASKNTRITKTVWSSKNKKIATVTKKGIVKGIKAGKTVISAKVTCQSASGKQSQKTLNCQVTVKKKSVSSSPAVPLSRYEESSSTNTEDSAPVYGTSGTVSAYSAEQSNYRLHIDASRKVHDISDLLYGIFIEDINFAADGGLYAEMVQNRSFEFTQLASDNEKHAWSDVGEVSAEVSTKDTAGALNENNPNYMVIKNHSETDAGIENCGFLDGMSIIKDSDYNFSVYAKGIDGYTGSVRVDIMNGTDSVASGTIESVTDSWKKYELTLTSSVTSHQNVKLRLTIPKGTVAVDMVSLFPQDTYKGRKNGLRTDLCEKLEALKPAFLRFPGGCVIEGVNLDAAYDWKDSIGVGRNGEPLKFNNTYGDVAARKLGQNIWTDERATNDKNPSFMTYGLGFYEYFLLAEDLGAVGVPVINCGMCCMAQGNGSGPAVGSEQMQQYIQDALDLVEFCRGTKDTKWGAVRTAMGHPEPFALKYIGIGNEQWGSNFYAHYKAFVEAFAEAKKTNPELYGDVELMFSAGVDDGDSDTVNYPAAYKEAFQWLQDNPGKTISDFAGAIDHHYYNSPDWFLQHADYYDENNYSRDTDHMTSTTYGGGIPVFVGEYAAQSNTLQAALSEAAYMTGLERNGDIIRMAAYAPLFGNLTALHWAPDLIWFNNHTATASTNYYMQKLFSNNAGTELLSSELDGAQIPVRAFTGKVGAGTWNTTASFDNIKVIDNDTKKVLASDDFSSPENSTENWMLVSDGTWKIADGKLVQSSRTTNIVTYENTGSAVYFGDSSWSNYTYTLDAVKISGEEGFLIPIAVAGSDNNYFWNLGGWGNTVSCLQSITDGKKSGQLAGTVKKCYIIDGKTYALKVVVTDTNIKCYLDNELYIDYDLPDTSNAESYQVVSTDKTGDIIIKLVNITGKEKTFAIAIDGAETIASKASVQTVAGNSLADDNILGQAEAVTLKESEIDNVSTTFNYTVPKYSATVLRIKK